MAADPFKVIEEAFGQASDLSGDARTTFLEQFRAHHPDLIDHLKRLLDTDRESDVTFCEPISASIKSAEQDLYDHWLGRQLGVWTLCQRIGAGGMGTVFLASRSDDEFRQTAAVKIMGGHVLNADASRRFRTERQILSNLNHPNIASLIDGGTTDEDLPYLVMEYVDGERIDVHCDTNGLPIPDRLQLFSMVCDAVDYAHRNLVVHRDLKPSNILVPRNGAPKLLDFGIAKLLDPGQWELTAPHTHIDARAMTPEYASPEQVRGEPVSVASDVYALGVLLFRLLTGHSPYGPSATTSREIEGAILAGNLKKPSTSIYEYARQDNKTPAVDHLSEKQSISPERLCNILKGDLDTIILKCLQKEPERRYKSARELAEDIARYLDNRPIIARSDSWPYTVKKFLVRHAGLVLASATAFIMIVSLTTFYILSLAEERDKAQLAAAEAQQVSGFLAQMFSSASPAVTQGSDVTVLDVIDSARNNIEALEGQETLQGKLLFIIAESYYWLGRDEEAIALYEQSLAKFAEVPAKPVAEMIETLIALGDAQARVGEYSTSISTLRSARDFAADEFGVNSSKAIWADTLIATNLSRQRRYEEALAAYGAALERFAVSPDKDDDLELFLLAGFANTLDDTGRLAESMALRERVVQRSEATKGAFHPNTIVRLHNLALGMRRQWLLEDARDQMKTAIDRGTATWSRENPTRRNHLGSYAITLQLLGEFAEAKLYLEEARDLALEIDGAESHSYVEGLLQLAIWNKDRGNLETAVAQFDDVVSRSIVVYGEGSFITSVCRLYLAQTLNELAEFDRSLDVSIAAMDDRDILTDSLKLALTMQYARALWADGQTEKALRIVDDLVQLRDGNGTLSGPETVSIFTEFANFYRNAGALDLAEGYARRAHDSGQHGLPEGNWYAALATAEYAYALAASNKSVQARQLASQAHADLSAVFGPDDYRLVALEELIGHP